MYIREIIVDGFKSYATRTVIAGWDPAFNAITGLNGSGKSNILDSICFVLGISNLSHVRAGNLLALASRPGRAGNTNPAVTFASANPAPQHKPVGYESYPTITITRQIVINGRNKYLINGMNAQQKAVMNLFQSVQLNVNNPHFLIMQGRITKVLSMKAPEILSMIEEAAGTRMFEDKKDSAIRTMERKDKKLVEIQTLLSEEITPKLDKLRKERSAFLEFQKIESELERLQQLVVAHQYTTLFGKLHSLEQAAEEKTARRGALSAERATTQTRIDEAQAQASDLLRQKEGNQLLRELTETTERLSEGLVRLRTQVDLKRQTQAEEAAGLERSRGRLAVLDQQLAQADASDGRLAMLQARARAIVSELDEKNEAVRREDALLSTLATGVGGSDAGSSGFAERLQEAKQNAGLILSEKKQAETRLRHLGQELELKRSQLQAASASSQALTQRYAQACAELDAIKARLATVNFDPAHEQALQAQHQAAQEALAPLLQSSRQLTDNLLRAVQFQFADPVAGFDRSLVRGLVAELIRIPPENLHTATALEIAAGGRLYNVVIENEVVGQQLLRHGQLRRRYNFIPLNKVVPPGEQRDRTARAQHVTGQRARPAISLVFYDEAVSPAMKYVFGSTLVCDDAATAKQVSLDDPGIRLRSVTLDGDLYDPRGTLTGGSRQSGAATLAGLHQLQQLQQEVARHQAAADRASAGLQALRQASQDFRQLRQQLSLKEHEVALFREQLEQSPQGQLTKLLEGLEAEAATASREIEAAAGRHATVAAEVLRLETDLRDLESNREAKLQSIRQNLARLKQERDRLSQEHQALGGQVGVAQAEAEQARADRAELAAGIDTAAGQLATLGQELAALEADLQARTAEFEAESARLGAERAQVTRLNEDLRRLESVVKAGTDQLNELDLETRRVEHELQRLTRDRDEATQGVQRLEEAHPWISEQREHFGSPGGPFDFATNNPADARRRLEHLEASHNRLAKNVNRKVMTMLERVEREEQTLKNKLSIVVDDKGKIETTIGKLDVKKRETVLETWRAVNTEFGLIFGDLLPGNTARLDPTSSGDVSDGLEIKVNLGGVWKESLTELSGGQRSLVALSLILALLKYKPAPLYILDEIDAALDLSHTQNIGQLLKHRFHGAQFIVVSLKEGMFSNANVIFQTKFRDGTSTVLRFSSAATNGRAGAPGGAGPDGPAPLLTAQEGSQQGLSSSSSPSLSDGSSSSMVEMSASGSHD
ncbi:hypothetical protein H696_05268 [Fonticula alba]|uniref:Structural maintenance of chromosomes protein n=1 Tax=Fonticula alba TaxID=691883 RepID=A0A058Z2I3_FONAL|nr:hypothetical protein H696_05268 [Fonticula alba]KCV68351.1 hypothetical protein H696_05268 [Fonticula alba]|eukprot:XP_009497405.1 hypothetical protein H696_05268 [Fonticula alba]